MAVNEKSYSSLTHPYKLIEVKEEFKNNTEFQIRDIPMEGITKIIRLFAYNQSGTVAKAYRQFVSILNTRSRYLEASLILGGKMQNNRTIWIRFSQEVAYMRCQYHGKLMNFTNLIAQYIGEAFEIPTTRVEKHIKLSAIQQERNIYYVQVNESLVFTALAERGFTFDPIWNKSSYEEEYTSAVKSVANKHDLRKIKNERIATMQNEAMTPIQRTGSLKSKCESEGGVITGARVGRNSSSASAISDDVFLDSNEVKDFTEETQKVLKQHGWGATFHNPMGESNNAFCSLFALLGFAVDSDVQQLKQALRAKLSLEEKNPSAMKIEFTTSLERTHSSVRRESSC